MRSSQTRSATNLTGLAQRLTGLLQSQAHPASTLGPTPACLAALWCSLDEHRGRQLGNNKRVLLPAAGAGTDARLFIVKLDRLENPPERSSVWREFEILEETRAALKAAQCRACPQAAAQVLFTGPPFEIRFRASPASNATTRYAILQSRLEGGGALLHLSNRHHRKLDAFWGATFAMADGALRNRSGASGTATRRDGERSSSAPLDARSLRLASVEPPGVQRTLVSDMLVWAEAFSASGVNIVDLQLMVDPAGGLWLFDPDRIHRSKPGHGSARWKGVMFLRQYALIVSLLQARQQLNSGSDVAAHTRAFSCDAPPEERCSLSCLSMQPPWSNASACAVEACKGWERAAGRATILRQIRAAVPSLVDDYRRQASSSKLRNDSLIRIFPAMRPAAPLSPPPASVARGRSRARRDDTADLCLSAHIFVEDPRWECIERTLSAHGLHPRVPPSPAPASARLDVLVLPFLASGPAAMPATSIDEHSGVSGPISEMRFSTQQDACHA